MKIELWYDFVYKETRVCIDGNWQDESDMYAFLYPVRKYPLQTWLAPAGSWTGIVRQLEDIARGEKIELEFHGRKIDFDDLFLTAREMDNAEITYIEWDTLAQYDDKISVLSENIAKLQTQIPVNESLVSEVMNLPDRQINEEEWLAVVRSAAELWSVQKDARLCCVIDGDNFDSFEEFEAVGQLTHSMRRPADAVCCCFSNAANKEIFEKYASEFPGMHFVFALNSERDWKEKLWTKYGQAGWKVWQMKEGIRLCETVLEYLEEQKTENNNMRMELVHRNMETGVSREIENGLESCKEMASHIYGWQKTWQKLRGSLSEHLSESLGIVQK